MIKGILSFAIFSCALIASAEEKADTVKNPLQAAYTVSLNSNGISSIPYFSLDKPAVVSAITLRKGRFSYEPQLAFDLQIRPWYIDNWIHYRLIDSPKIEVRTGVNFSTFFQDHPFAEDTTLATKYFDMELGVMYKFTKSSLMLLYWNDKGMDPGTVQGHFISLVAERPEIKAGQRLYFSANVQIFYIDYNDNNDGLFLSPKVNAYLRNNPFSLFFLCTQPFWTNMTPAPEFKWNAGLAYSF